ncbi:MAG: hypothetical protein ACYC6K_13140 [Bellilinea sp.]
MRRSLHLHLFVFLSLTGWLLAAAGCASSGLPLTPQNRTATATTSVTPEKISTEQPTNTASPTATRTSTATITSTPEPTTTPTAGPSLTPTQIPRGTLTPTPLPIEAGLFRVVFSLRNMSPGLVNGIYPRSGQRAIITGSYGLLQVDIGSGDVNELRTPNRLLGIDASGHAWLTPANGAAITSWNGTQVTAYDATDGWLLNASFFDAPLGGSRLVNGRAGEVWLATATDLRYFDGERWRIFGATESGLHRSREAYVHTALVLAVNPNTGEAIAGACDWRGATMLTGGSVRRYDGESWSDAGFPVDNPCLTGLQAAPDGTIYAAGDGKIWRIKGSSGWEELTLPRLPSGRYYGLVEELALDLEGQLWPLIQLTDVDGVVFEKVRLRPQATGWKIVGTLDRLQRQQLLFLPGNRVWALEQAKIYALEASGEWSEQASLDFRSGGSDSEGGIWLVTDVETSPVIWRGAP